MTKNKRKQLPHWKRIFIARAYNFTCYWCTKVFDEKKLVNEYGYLFGHDYWRDSIHIDHVIPLCKGGTDDLGNLVVACADCNLRKSKNIWP